MGRLFKNELLKIRYNRTIWIFWGISVVLVALISAVDTGMFLGLGVYGYTVSFTYIKVCGTFVIMFLAPVAGALFTEEFRQGTIHNTLSCGVSRRQYFIVKALCVLGIDLFVYLFCLVEFVCINTIIKGWFPPNDSYSYPDYGLVNLAYHSGCCLLLCVYIAFYICVAVSVKRPAIVYLSGAVAVMGELTVMLYVPAYKGVLPALLDMYDMVAARKLLTPEFAGLFGQGSIMLVIFLALAFWVFTRRDIS